MLKIYGLNASSPSNKVRYTANALGLDYQFEQVNLTAGEGQKTAYLAVHPLGKVPAIDDGGFKLFESGAICRYLAGKVESSFYPSELKERAEIDQWADFSTSHIMNAVSKIVFNRVFYKFLGAEPDSRSLEEGQAWLVRYLPLVESQLAENSNLAGQNRTLADIHLVAALDPCEAAGIPLEDYPATSEWRKSIMAEKFYQDVHPSFLDTLEKLAG